MIPPLRATRAGVVGSLLVLLAAATCVRLGFWQLHRLQERRARNGVVTARMVAPPVQVIGSSRDTAGLTFRSASARGTFDAARTIVLAARSLEGNPGVYVLTPLRLADGGAILVNRGWLPSPDAATVDLRPYLAVGDAEVRGLLLPMPLGRSAPAEIAPGVWFTLDPAALARQIPYRLHPLILQITPRPGDTPALPRLVPPPAVDEGPHLGYALQWFGFAAVAVLGWMTLALRANGGGKRVNG